MKFKNKLKKQLKYTLYFMNMRKKNLKMFKYKKKSDFVKYLKLRMKINEE